MHEIISSFRENMFLNGIKAPQILHASGKIERFYMEGDKSGTKNGWYILFADDFPNGVYGHWKTGVTHTWSMKSKKKMTHYERSCYASQMKAVIQHREQLRMSAQKNVAQLATVCFHFYKTAKQNHPYLIKKRISPFCARQFEQTLVLPIMDINGSLHSLQFISPEGKKTFLQGGAIKGHFIPVHGKASENKQILICEGFATGASLAAMFPDACIIAACNAGNLKSVALNMRTAFPKARVLICADCDFVGLSKAREAAIASGSLFCHPTFPEEYENTLKDFNDYYCLMLRKGVFHV